MHTPGQHSFSKWDATGNTTLFFDRPLHPELVCKALANTALGAEQAGFLDMDKRTLTMAGGEFCVNATRAFGAELFFAGQKTSACGRDAAAEACRYTVQVSGWPSPIGLLVEQRAQASFYVAAELSFARRVQPVEQGVIVHLPGISHLVCPGERPADAKAAAMELMQAHDLLGHDACGVVWYRREKEGWSVDPVVYVRTLATLFEEGSCGSGSLAMAVAAFGTRGEAGEAAFAIRQPSGMRLDVGLSKDGSGGTLSQARVGGPVSLVCRGQWYPAGQ